MMGIFCAVVAYVYGSGNQYVLENTSISEFVLQKKPHSLEYRFVHGRCTYNEWQTTYENTHMNPSNILAKTLLQQHENVMRAGYSISQTTSTQMTYLLQPSLKINLRTVV